MRVTVTGGAGYIGALLVAELTTGGWDVTVLDSLLHGQASVASAVAGLGARLIEGDVRDAAAREEALSGADGGRSVPVAWRGRPKIARLSCP